MLAAGMAADNLAMAVYFGVIMSIHVDRTGFTSTFPGGGGNPSSYYFPSTISLWEKPVTLLSPAFIHESITLWTTLWA